MPKTGAKSAGMTTALVTNICPPANQCEPTDSTVCATRNINLPSKPRSPSPPTRWRQGRFFCCLALCRSAAVLYAVVAVPPCRVVSCECLCGPSANPIPSVVAMHPTSTQSLMSLPLAESRVVFDVCAGCHAQHIDTPRNCCHTPLLIGSSIGQLTGGVVGVFFVNVLA